MRNWVVCEVKDLKNLPVTNSAVRAIWKSSSQHGIIWFLHRPQGKDREAPGFCGLSKILTERRKLKCGDRKKNDTIFR